MRFFAIWGDYCVEVYAAEYKWQAWAEFLENHDERNVYECHAGAPVFGYPWTGCTMDSMEELTADGPERVLSYYE